MYQQMCVEIIYEYCATNLFTTSTPIRLERINHGVYSVAGATESEPEVGY